MQQHRASGKRASSAASSRKRASTHPLEGHARRARELADHSYLYGPDGLPTMSDIAVDTSAIVEVMIEGPEAKAVLDTEGAADHRFCHRGGARRGGSRDDGAVRLGALASSSKAWDRLGMQESPG